MPRLMTEALPGPSGEAVLDRCRHRYHRPGEVLFSEGAAADTLHLVVSGHVMVKVTTAHGACITLAVLGPGSTFGELALLSAPPLRSATVTACGACETLTLHRRDLEQLRLRYPGVDGFLLDLLARQVRRLTELLTEALHLPAEQRVLRRLVDLAQAFASSDTAAAHGIRVPVTQDVLATMAGTSRVTTNQVLQRLQRSGTVLLGRGRITIPDLRAVQRAADDGAGRAVVPAPLSRGPGRGAMVGGGQRQGARVDGVGGRRRT
jgi:CRP/FNR family transcriptional regulator, cyclic AMP receptor protein